QNIYDERTGWVLYNYIINQSSLNKVKDAMKKNLSTSTKTMTKEMDFDIEDKFEMTTIGKTGLSATKLYTLLPNFEGKSIDYAKSWLNSNGITDIKIEYVESDKDDGTILSQSLHSSKRVDLIKGSITFKVAEKKEEVVDPTPVEPTDPTDPTEPTNPGEDNTPTTEPGEDTKPETPSTGENTEETNNNE
ncbi:MAG: PASTA domain-containing protein, partial [Tenericutes bacterium]|nr:PASTA domain-containing protein [Mycoplasmatota bacterium]